MKNNYAITSLLYSVYIGIALPILIFYIWEFINHLSDSDGIYDAPNFAFAASLVGYYFYYFIVLYLFSFVLLINILINKIFDVFFKVAVIHIMWIIFFAIIIYSNISPANFNALWKYDLILSALSIPLTLIPAYFRLKSEKSLEMGSEHRFH